MITFKYLVRKDKKRADGTWNVCIRVTYDRKVRYLQTAMYVTKKDLTPKFAIKNYQVIDRCEMLVATYRKRAMELDLELNRLSMDTVMERLMRKGEIVGETFTNFALRWIADCKLKGAKNYECALHALQRYFRRDVILFTDVTVNTMKGFERFLDSKPRAQSQYTTAIMKIFNDAREYYNDDDSGEMLIKHTLRKYRAPKQNVAKKRALTLEQVRAIFGLPYTGMPRGNRRDLVLDCFRLSFLLMGMNAVDLYNACCMEDGMIIYYRTKTKDRRSDRAEMRVRIHPAAEQYIRKYAGDDGHVFNFCKRFSTPSDFTRSLNVGLKAIGQEIGVEGLQFYAARHSMATIAVNDARINKYIVNDMLCHVDPAMHVTDLYIKKDFEPMNEANFHLIDFVLGDEAAKVIE